ncbi:hypothetical protein M422DRAFT_250776 [Sphaerobolus stellatus SS14]|uniref:Uncharacterized protein n=1 Tax=Sphaerobolus stellatus (strain SS14) TaxID=990650 RepID=A0A0C9W335_SPHS4|nr:hypothetical protein M422DRAFT_250776 [Sphaerobolus stellatus SS14]
MSSQQHLDTDLDVPHQVRNTVLPYEEAPHSGEPETGNTAPASAGASSTLQEEIKSVPPAPNKGKQPVTASLQSCLSVHAPTPAKTGESSQQCLDADLDSYHQSWELVLPYDEVPATSDASSTLPSESTMNVDQELDDLYQ